ncbi:MAG: hypothetical protein ACJ788_12565 [Ktedonobacteraceae bacterium]
MTVERPHEVFAPPTDAGSTEGHQDNPLISFAALQEQGNPEVLELISTLYDAYTVQRSLENAANIQQLNALETPKRSVEQYGSVLSIDPSFTERYRRGSLFVAAAVHIMCGSFTAYPEDPEYLRATVDAAFAPYGYMVAEGSVPGGAQYPLEYSLALSEQRNTYEELGRGKYISNKKLEFYMSADDQWEAIGQWQEEPEVVKFADQLTKLHHLRLRMPSTGIMLRHLRRAEDEVNIPGLHPYYRERYALARTVVEETEGAMTEGVGYYKYGSYYRWLISLVNHFNDAFYDLDMHIDVNPSWEPDQPSLSVPESPTERIIKIEEVKE